MENNLQCIYEDLTFKFKEITITNNIIELILLNDFTIQIMTSDEKFNVTMILFYLSTEILNSRSIIHKRNIPDTINNFMIWIKNNYCTLLYEKLIKDFTDNDYVIENIIDEIKIILPGTKNYMLVISMNTDFTKIGLVVDSVLIESISLFSYAKIHELINFYIDCTRLICKLDI